MKEVRILLLGGTTASGKSALALAVAARTGAVVVNADSQQLFADLPILTARPGAADLAAAPHRLYGVLAADEQPSAGRWLELLAPALAEALDAGRPVLIVGGTGLYLHAYLHGISPVPRVPRTLREALADETADMPSPAIHARLAALDPGMAARLRPSDRQRILRALEVVQATGRSLADWQALPRERPPLPMPRGGVALVPPAAVVAPRIEARLTAMLGAGAAEEVAALAAHRPDLEHLPIAKVHGLRDILAWQRGEQDEGRMRERIAAQIRQYAKRQRTFLRHQLPGLRPLQCLGDMPAADELAQELAALAAG